MPQGESVAAPPGFTDLCQRDLDACGAASEAPRLALASTTNLTTSSLGGQGAEIPAPRLEAEPSATIGTSVQLIQLEAYRPDIDATFIAAGAEHTPAREPVQTAQNEQPTTVVAARALLDKSQMRLVNTLNREVNRDVHKANDFDLYGLLEFWSLPRVIDGKMYGDCEDYALEKRRRLIAAGVPAEAMSMAVAVTARGESHAVLVVSFESGDWVLDNLTPWATPWGDLNYRWLERQVPGSSEWKKIT